MTNEQLTIEIIKLVVSLLTPLLILVIGVVITKKIEKNKLSVLKEKEWQVKWAEIFLKQATDFNNNISLVICSLFRLQTESNQTKIDEIIKIISNCNILMSEIDWNIRNYAQFSKKYGIIVVEKQQKLMESIQTLISERKGNLEEIRKQQFEYNDSVKKAHSDILNMK